MSLPSKGKRRTVAEAERSATMEVRSQVESFDLKVLVKGSVERRHIQASGFIVADFSFRPIYANSIAMDILNRFGGPYEAAEWEAAIQKRLRLILQAPHYVADLCSPATFVSGQRRYTCQPFLLEVQEDQKRPARVGLLMERPVAPQAWLLEASRRYHLSPREYETVLHLSHGLTTKEIAERMHVSPNTVKQFVRLIMSKMQVATRSGVLGKLLSA